MERAAMLHPAKRKEAKAKAAPAKWSPGETLLFAMAVSSGLWTAIYCAISLVP